MIEYLVTVKQVKGQEESMFLFANENDARKKLEECRQWNKDNPNDKAMAYMSVDNVIKEIVR